MASSITSQAAACGGFGASGIAIGGGAGRAAGAGAGVWDSPCPVANTAAAIASPRIQPIPYRPCRKPPNVFIESCTPENRGRAAQQASRPSF
ncbi:MAG: hypothetical protein ACTHOH_04120 [Lysobacteraceae bacterium]